MSFSPTTSTKKRKADALGDSDPTGSGDRGDGAGGRPAVIARLKDATSVSDNPSSPTTTPHLPPPVWGRVLDFMPYEEVRSALLVGKIIADEAVGYVRTLNFMKSCQLDGPSVRRFASVEEVNFLCLISGQYGSAVLCRDTTTRLVPLLQTFSKVKHIFVGGLVAMDAGNGQKQLIRYFYDPYTCSSPANHRELAKSFCYSLLGASKARLLSQALDKSEGILGPFFHNLNLCSGRADGETANSSKGMCTICRDVCSYFPLNEIIHYPYFCECVKEIDVYEKVSKRKGARKIFRNCSNEHLPNFADDRLNEFTIQGEALRRRLTDLGMSCGDENKHIWYLTMDGINDIDRMIAVGCDPRSVSKEILYEGMQIGRYDRQFDVFAKSTFDALVARGFAFDEADIIVLDERMEPALKDLPALIRGETDNT